MAQPANRLYARDFSGPDVQGVVDPWGGFDFPIEKVDSGLNPQSGAQSGINGVPMLPFVNEPFIPTLDGSGHGVGTHGGGAFFTIWRLKASANPGTPNCQTFVQGKWNAPGSGANHAIGVLGRMIDARNTLSAYAITRNPGETPLLRLSKIIAGVETVLGTYAGLANLALQNGIEIRLAMRDLSDGTGKTVLKVYTGGNKGTSRGTERISATVDLGPLRGSWGTGVELRGMVEADGWVDNHEAYDLADESDVDLDDGSLWVLELDGVRKRMSELRAYAPPIQSFHCMPRIGPDGNGLSIAAGGDWIERVGLRPMMPIKAYYNGVCYFAGKIGPGSRSIQPGETQSWEGMDAQILSRDVKVADDDRTTALYWNVFDTESELYRKDRQGKTIGQVLAFLEDRYLDVDEGLRFYGAAPPSGRMFVDDELAKLDAVFPDLPVSGNFQACVLALLARMRQFQLWVDPTTGIWHFIDLDGGESKTLSMFTDKLRVLVAPDPRASDTAIEFVGGRKEGDAVKLTFGKPGTPDNTKPAWTTPQEAKAGLGDKTKGTFGGFISGSGAELFHGVMRTYLVVAPAYGFTEDEWRGAIESTASDGQFVVGNTDTKIYLGPAAWPGGDGPDAGEPFLLTVLDDDAVKWLTDIGVGQAYYAPPIEEIDGCGASSAGTLYGMGIQAGQACGKATVLWEGGGAGGGVQTAGDRVEFQIVRPSAKAAAAGFGCPLLVLGKPPLPPVGLLNHLPPSSSPSDISSPCEQGGPVANAPRFQLEATIKTYKSTTPRVRVPANAGEYRGPAFAEDPAAWDGGGSPKPEDWGIRRTLPLPLPDFVDQAAQGPGLVPAGNALLKVLGQKANKVEIAVGAPWMLDHPDYPLFPKGYKLSQFTLGMRLRVTSPKRETGLERVDDVILYAIDCDVLANELVLTAGTAVGWLSLDAEEIAKPFLLQATLQKTARMVKDAFDAINCELSQPVDTAGATGGSITPGCNVPVNDEIRKTTKTVEVDDEQKKSNINHLSMLDALGGMVSGLRRVDFPGQQPDVPGFGGAAAQQYVGKGALLGPLVKGGPLYPGVPEGPNGDRGRLGGPITTDAAAAGEAPLELWRGPKFRVVKVADATGEAQGAFGIGKQALTSQGAPTGPITPIEDFTSLEDGVLPMSLATPGGFPAQLRDRTKRIASVLGLRTDAGGRYLEAGTVTAEYPDGVPADNVTAMLAAMAVAGGSLRALWDTVGQLSGLVFHGPVGPEGADAGLDWIVDPESRALFQVEAVGAGDGINGGRWANVVGEDGSLTQLVQGGWVHKQIDGDALAALRADGSIPGDVEVTDFAEPAASDSPSCYIGGAGRVLLGGDHVTGAGGIRSMPPGTVGDIGVVAHVKEQLVGVPEDADHVAALSLRYAVQGSAWSDPVSTAEQEAPKTDGDSTGTGVLRFTVPGGAVPAGLRKPFDLDTSIVRDGNNGSMTGNVVLTALGIYGAVADLRATYKHRLEVTYDREVRTNRGFRHLGVSYMKAHKLTVKENVGLDVTVAFREAAYMDRPWTEPLSIEVGLEHGALVSPTSVRLDVGVSLTPSWTFSE